MQSFFQADYLLPVDMNYHRSSVVAATSHPMTYLDPADSGPNSTEIYSGNCLMQPLTLPNHTNGNLVMSQHQHQSQHHHSQPLLTVINPQQNSLINDIHHHHQQQQQQQQQQQPPQPQQQQQTQLSGASSPSDYQQQICAICGDRATGKHYGAFSCDGCKGFFRRSVRKHHQYSCRFNRCCVIDKDKRNTCRFCRLDKCCRAGMKKEAVQNERDKISVRRSSYDDYATSNDLSISKLLQAEHRTTNLNSQDLITMVQGHHTAGDMLAEVFPMVSGPQQAGLNDVCNSMRIQLLSLVEWAKSLSVFVQLQVNEQISLLRAHAGEMLILGVVWRTMRLGSSDTLVLGNHTIITRENVEFQSVTSRILDELVSTFRDLEIEETEYSCLKAIVFFDPDAPDLQQDRTNVRNWRHQIQLELMDYMNDRQYMTRGRFGTLLLLLPKLQSVAQIMIQEVHAARIYNKVVIDKLLQELLLTGEKESPANNRTEFQGTVTNFADDGYNMFSLNGACAAPLIMTSPVNTSIEQDNTEHQGHHANLIQQQQQHHQHFVFNADSVPLSATPRFYHLENLHGRGTMSQPSSPNHHGLSMASRIRLSGSVAGDSTSAALNQLSPSAFKQERRL